MPRYPCPVCHDPNGFPLWIDERPPEGCPHDESWMEGRRREVNNVGDCPFQRQKAWQAAELRRLSPDCFDQNGNMKPGRSGDAWRAYMVAHPAVPVVM